MSNLNWRTQAKLARIQDKQNEENQKKAAAAKEASDLMSKMLRGEVPTGVNGAVVGSAIVIDVPQPLPTSEPVLTARRGTEVVDTVWAARCAADKVFKQQFDKPWFSSRVRMRMAMEGMDEEDLARLEYVIAEMREKGVQAKASKLEAIQKKADAEKVKEERRVMREVKRQRKELAEKKRKEEVEQRKAARIEAKLIKEAEAEEDRRIREINRRVEAAKRKIEREHAKEKAAAERKAARDKLKAEKNAVKDAQKATERRVAKMLATKAKKKAEAQQSQLAALRKIYEETAKAELGLNNFNEFLTLMAK